MSDLSSFSTIIKLTNLDYLTNHFSGYADFIGMKGLNEYDAVIMYSAVTGGSGVSTGIVAAEKFLS